MLEEQRVDEVAVGISDPNLRRLYGYWLERKASRRYPARRDIDPVDLRYILGHMMLVDVLREPLRFRVRLHGANLASRAGYDLTGKSLDAIPDPNYRGYVIRRCEALIASGEPLAVRHDRVIDGWPMPYEALWLPFSDQGTEITMLLCALVYDVRKPSVFSGNFSAALRLRGGSAPSPSASGDTLT